MWVGADLAKRAAAFFRRLCRFQGDQIRLNLAQPIGKSFSILTTLFKNILHMPSINDSIKGCISCLSAVIHLLLSTLACYRKCKFRCQQLSSTYTCEASIKINQRLSNIERRHSGHPATFRVINYVEHWILIYSHSFFSFDVFRWGRKGRRKMMG